MKTTSMYKDATLVARSPLAVSIICRKWGLQNGFGLNHTVLSMFLRLSASGGHRKFMGPMYFTIGRTWHSVLPG